MWKWVEWSEVVCVECSDAVFVGMGCSGWRRCVCKWGVVGWSGGGVYGNNNLATRYTWS